MINFLGTTDVASLLNVSADMVHHLATIGRIPYKRVNNRGKLLFHPVDVERLIQLRGRYKTVNSLTPDILWVECACKYLANTIRRTYNPTQLIAIAFGGNCPGSLLSTYLKVPMYSIQISYYNDRERGIHPQLEGDIIVKNLPLLVVDDLVDSGDTMNKMYSVLLEHGIDSENIKSATLHRKPSSTLVPDWYVEVVADSDWVVYPWEGEIDAR